MADSSPWGITGVEVTRGHDVAILVIAGECWWVAVVGFIVLVWQYWWESYLWESMTWCVDVTRRRVIYTCLWGCTLLWVKTARTMDLMIMVMWWSGEWCNCIVHCVLIQCFDSILFASIVGSYVGIVGVHGDNGDLDAGHHWCVLVLVSCIGIMYWRWFDCGRNWWS